MRSLVYLVASVLDLVLTFVLAHYVGAWAAVAGYVAYVVLATWLFMNWYYHARVGLDMALFWRRVLPVVAACALPAALCVAGTVLLPVADMFGFLAWGVAYTLLCGLMQRKFVLNEDEKGRFGRLLAKLGRGRPDGRSGTFG